MAVPYSLGDAIDWKLGLGAREQTFLNLPYSLGDAIDWKHYIDCHCFTLSSFPYSLGDAIDWKQSCQSGIFLGFVLYFPYSLGDAIDWKPIILYISASSETYPLLARGRDRLETRIVTAFLDQCKGSPTR